MDLYRDQSLVNDDIIWAVEEKITENRWFIMVAFSLHFSEIVSTQGFKNGYRITQNEIMRTVHSLFWRCLDSKGMISWAVQSVGMEHEYDLQLLNENNNQWCGDTRYPLQRKKFKSVFLLENFMQYFRTEKGFCYELIASRFYSQLGYLLPVSYTHLDVYKRQLLQIMVDCGAHSLPQRLYILEQVKYLCNTNINN